MNTNYDTGHRGSVEEFQSYLGAEYADESFLSDQVNYGQHYPQDLYGQRFSLTHDSSQYSDEQLLDASVNFNLPNPDFARDSDNGFNTQDIQRLTIPRDAGPWTGQRRALPPNPRASSSNDGFKRPALPARRSNNGSLDSGIGSANGMNFIGSQNEHNSNSSNQLANDASRIPDRGSQNENVDPSIQASTQGRKRKTKYEATICPDCPPDRQKVLKNKSEAEKHRLQHLKPCTCEVEGCPRSEVGFATENDLQRHRKSVHGFDPSVGKKTGYICQGCPPPGPDTTPKFWPRLDNFKAHIKRRHTNWVQEDLIRKSETLRPPDVVSESGYASQYQSSVPPDGPAYQCESFSPVAPSMSRNGSRQDGMALFGLGDQHHFDQLAGIGEGQHADRNLGNREPGLSLHGTSSGSIGNRTTAHPKSPHQLVSPVDSTLTSPSVSSHSIQNILFGQHDYHRRASSFSGVHYYNPPSKRQKTVDSRYSHTELTVYRNENGEWACPECPKTKRRECELRKHMKRHSRPYGCTFANCSKRFGSRNDWKRHENTQHFLQEMWRCEFNGPDGNKCAKLAFHVKTFANHLQRKHGIPLKSPENEARCRSMHLGREGHDHFWCGFCNSLIEQKDTMEQGAYDVRFRHIGYHFDKEGKWIDEWIDIEENRKKGLIAREGRKKNRARYRNGGGDEDSDLGDDGIPPFVTGYSVSVSHGPPSYGPGMSAQVNLYSSNKDGMRDTDLDADAVSDSEWR